jgi:hypothetical protein
VSSTEGGPGLLTLKIQGWALPTASIRYGVGDRITANRGQCPPYTGAFAAKLTNHVTVCGNAITNNNTANCNAINGNAPR